MHYSKRTARQEKIAIWTGRKNWLITSGTGGAVDGVSATCAHNVTRSGRRVAPRVPAQVCPWHSSALGRSAEALSTVPSPAPMS